MICFFFIVPLKWREGRKNRTENIKEHQLHMWTDFKVIFTDKWTWTWTWTWTLMQPFASWTSERMMHRTANGGSFFLLFSCFVYCCHLFVTESDPKEGFKAHHGLSGTFSPAIRLKQSSAQQSLIWENGFESNSFVFTQFSAHTEI